MIDDRSYYWVMRENDTGWWWEINYYYYEGKWFKLGTAELGTEPAKIGPRVISPSEVVND